MRDAPIITELGDEDFVCRPLFKTWHDLWCADVGAKCNVSFVKAGHSPTEGYAHRFLNYLYTNLGADALAPANNDHLAGASFRKFDQQEFID